MPQIIPPISWLRAVVGFMIRPAAKAETARRTRTSRVRACTPTSMKWAPNERRMSFACSVPRAMAGWPA